MAHSKPDVWRTASALVTEHGRDARFVASWGRIWWRGRGQVELQTRTGNTERPDVTWSEWSAPYKDPAGGSIAHAAK